jgi:hypothetical protein
MKSNIFPFEMLNQDYILLIFNCYKYRDKALQQKANWLPVLPSNLLYFHVLGDPNLETEFQFLIEDNILLVKVEDDYNSLPKKVIRAYQAILNTYEFKYIFKTDDDQQVTNIKIFETIMSLLNKKYEDPDQKIHYGGNIVDVKQTYKSQYYRIHAELPQDLLVKATKYCSGRFYFLSLNATQFLVEEKKELIESEFLEDYAIGYYLKNIYKTNMLHLDTNKYFVDFVI